MVFDSYINIIKTQANTTKGTDFIGIFGLGERITNKYFIEDGSIACGAGMYQVQ